MKKTISAFALLALSGHIHAEQLVVTWQSADGGVTQSLDIDAIERNGDLVEMRFRIDDQDHVDVPQALQNAVESDPETQGRWAALSAGKKRMFTFHVASARSPATEAKRIAEAKAAIDLGLSVRDFQMRRPKPL